MPGIIIGEVDEDIISVIKDEDSIQGFQGQIFSEYSESTDSYCSIGSIKELFSLKNEIKFYKKIFQYRKIFSKEVSEQLGLMSPEEIFYSHFKTQGFTKIKILTYEKSFD